MRKVDAPADFAAALESCRREAKASFGNDEVLLEKWITSPRHIEVQVFGDSHGNVVHLFERDCSLQRRHQKVIEEAPAPGMDEATRESICAAAVRAAKAVDYEGAGTIEFIADASEGLRADRIFFMEMNTRLQVEHPVTEEITGVDLVEWQLRVASGEPIPLRQEELSINGHAIEARLYAEDPAKGFLPSTGRLERLHLHEPFVGWAVDPEVVKNAEPRIETGVVEGSEVSPFYDPMIAKLITKGDDRTMAINRLVDLIREVQVWPVKTNAAFLRRLVDHERFRAGDVTTAFIGSHEATLIGRDEVAPELLQAALSHLLTKEETPRYSPWTSLSGLRLNGQPRRAVTAFVDGEPRNVELADLDEDSDFELLARVHATADDEMLLFQNGESHVFSLTSRATGHASAADGAIIAPMPGKVIAVDVAEGQAVTAGQRLLVLEAMKMEHALAAPFDGVIEGLTVSAGAQVQVEAVLCTVVPAPSGT
jgi:3-methylcrotonyl-CoA carboxylase alpha subunit